MEIRNRFKSALAAFRKTENKGVDPNSFLRYGKRRMPSTWSTPEITDEDFYTGYGFAVINKRANRSVVLGKKFLYTDAKEEIIKKANEEGRRVIHPYLDLIQNSVDFSERDFWYDISTYLDLEGIYYLMAVRTVTPSGKVGRIQKFSLLNPYRVRPVVSTKGELGGYVESDGNRQREIPKEMIIKICLLNPFDPSKPYSLADAARDSQFTMKQANDFAREAIDGNLNAPGILSSAIELPDDQFDNFVNRIKDHGRGEPLFGNGSGTITWTDMQTDLDKAALDKINNISRDTLLAVSGLSKTGVGVEESGTGREVSRTQKDDFTENAVMPQIENIIDALNLDYRKYYESEYKNNRYTIALDNPLETDRDAEKKDVEIRQEQFELLQELIKAGYAYDIAAKYAKGLIEVTDLGEASELDEPEEEEPEQPEEEAEEEEQPEENSTPPTLELYQGYPIPLIQYLDEHASQIVPMSEKSSMLYLSEASETVRIQNIEDRDNELIGVIDEHAYVKLGEFEKDADKEMVLNKLNKRYHNQLVAVKHKGIKRDLSKDFYNKLPPVVGIVLNNLYEKYQDREWFELAWEKYREHVLNSTDEDLMMPGFVFSQYIKGGSRDKVYSLTQKDKETPVHTHAVPFDQQEQIDISTQTLLSSVQSVENQMLTWYLDQISNGYLDPRIDTESYSNGLALPFAVWFTVMFPIFSAQVAEQTARDLEIRDIPVTVITEDVKSMIQRFAAREAQSHTATIKGDIENALTIIRTQTSDPNEIKAMLQEAFIEIQKRRAPLIATNASNRIFALSQYEADLQLLTRHGLVDRAYKQLYSSTGDPCPVCSYIIAQTNSSPTPFKEAFVSLGDTIEGDGRTMTFDYENILAGNVHPNCRCYYKIIIQENEEPQETETQTVSEIVAEQLAPILQKLDKDQLASDETVEKLSEMSERLQEQMATIETKLEGLDKRTKEGRQLKEELIEANNIKQKLEAAEDYARQLESLLDGQD